MKKLFLTVLLSALILSGCSFQEVLEVITPGKPQMTERPSIVFLGTEIPEMSDFVIISDSECVGDIKLRLLEVHDQTIRIEALEDTNLDGEFIPRNPTIQKLINGDSCIDARINCGEQSFQYCFNLNLDIEPIELSSEIK